MPTKINSDVEVINNYGCGASYSSIDISSINGGIAAGVAGGLNTLNSFNNNAKTEYMNLSNTGGDTVNIGGITYDVDDLDIVSASGRKLYIKDNKVLYDTNPYIKGATYGSSITSMPVGGKIVIDGKSYDSSELTCFHVDGRTLYIKDSLVLFDSQNEHASFGSGRSSTANFGSGVRTSNFHTGKEKTDVIQAKRREAPAVTPTPVVTKRDYSELIKNLKDYSIKIASEDISNVITNTDEVIVKLKNGNVIKLNNKNEITSLYIANSDLTYYYEDGHIIGSSDPSKTGIFLASNNSNGQYGGSQCDFNSNTEELLQNKDIMRMLQEKFGTNDPQACSTYLKSINTMGCHFTALINSIFSKYQGKEKEFYDTFGFSMYSVDSNGNIDYNYETLITDVHSYYWNTSMDYHSDGVWDHYGTSNIWDAAYRANGEGINSDGIATCYKYLQDKYNISGSMDTISNRIIDENEYNELVSSGKSLIFNSNAYTLYTPDGTWIEDNYRYGHSMTITGFTTDSRGNRVMTVSNWGNEYLLYPNPNYSNSFVYYDVVE